MDLGCYMLGEIVPLRVWSRTSAGVPTNPDATPVAMIYDSSGTRAATQNVPAHDQVDITAFFQYPFCLDGRFSTGKYSVIYRFQISSGTNRSSTDSFEIVAGGNAAGSGNSMFYFQSSQRDVICVRTDLGTVRRMFNPRL